MAETHSSKRAWRPSETDRVLPRWLNTSVIVILLAIVLVPVIYLLLLSVMPDTEVAFGKVSLASLHLSNYVTMWSTAPLVSSILHTIIIAGCASVASIALGVLAAYPLTRLTFRGRSPFLHTLIWTQTVPGTTLLLPLFVVIAYIQTALGIHLIGGYVAITVTYMTFALPLSTWLLVAYMRTVPRELEEAALVDGCSRVAALRRVIVPIALPALVVAFVFAFLVGWNDVLFASVLTNHRTQTLGVTLQQFASSQTGTELPLYGQLLAASVVTSVPVVGLYLFFQRYLVQGLGAGALTGV